MKATSSEIFRALVARERTIWVPKTRSIISGAKTFPFKEESV